MKKLVIFLMATMLMFGVANAQVTYERTVDADGKWTDNSYLGYNSGDTLKVTNNSASSVTVKFRNVKFTQVGTSMTVNASDNNTSVIPDGTHWVCLGDEVEMTDCFRADAFPVPSLTTYGLIALAALIGLTGLWMYRRKKATTIA